MIRKALLFAGLILPSMMANAAGYLEFDSSGLPYKWDSPVSYRLDLGSLGNAGINIGMTNAEADSMVIQAFAAWGGIPGATLVFNQGADVPIDITESNITAYVNFNGASCPLQDFVVVYDNDGEIFSELFGSASGSILGIASPSVLENSTRKILCGYALINGDSVPDNTLSTQQSVLYTLMHELGHGQNIEHSEINEELSLDGNLANDEFIPLMFPVIPTGLTAALAGGIGGIKLDDQFSIHFLYNQALLGAEGRIKGTVTNKKGDGILGANVLCFDKNNPLENIVSWISDSELDGLGEYECGHLPSGDYQVKITHVTKAINEWEEGTPPYIPTEFFNGDHESSDPNIDILTEKTDIAVASNTITGINLIVNDNGMITSTEKVTGTIDAGSAADLEYFIYVPKSVKKATFQLESTPSASDVDIYGKCDVPFSLALDTAGPIYSPTSPQSQQADFAGAGSTGSETVELDSSSNPKIENCEYHLLLINYDSSSASFEFTVTLEGNTPQLKANFDPKNIVQDNGETLVSEVTFEAQDDQFTISSIKFTDNGVLPVGDVSLVSLYEDDNNNGRVDEADTLLGTANGLDSNRTFTLTNLNVFIDEGGQKNFLISYTIPTTSSISIILAIAIAGMILMSLRRRENRHIFSIFLLIVALIQCSGSSDKDYNPVIVESTDLQAEASGFGDKFEVQVGKPASVKDFFE
jgi:hypothetical protein